VKVPSLLLFGARPSLLLVFHFFFIFRPFSAPPSYRVDSFQAKLRSNFNFG
jgi:hypothetical protein